MIALRSDVVLVTYEDGHSAPFDLEKLSRSIAEAAAVAGHFRWPLAEHVASAVAIYFETDWPGQNVSRQQVLHAVATVLDSLGHHDIAAVYRQTHERAVLDLADLAVQTPSGFDMEFYRLLGAQLDRVCALGLARLEFRHLRCCVKILTGKRSWRTRCKGVSDEVVAFIRNKLAASLKERPCEFVVSS